MSEERYARAFRRMHPKTMPYNIHEHQRELSDLWPVDQQRFRDMMDALNPTPERTDDDR